MESAIIKDLIDVKSYNIDSVADIEIDHGSGSISISASLDMNEKNILKLYKEKSARKKNQKKIFHDKIRHVPERIFLQRTYHRRSKPVPIPTLSNQEFSTLLNTIVEPSQITSTTTDMSGCFRQQLNRKLNTFRHSRLSRSANIFATQKYISSTPQINHIFTSDGTKESIDSLLKGPTAEICQQSLTNELGRLAQGIGSITGNDCVDFIHKSEVLPNKKVTYANMVCDFRPLKQEKY